MTRTRVLTALIMAPLAIAAILLLVLAKPRLSMDGLPRWMVEPGGLQSFSSTMIPMP